MSTTVDDLMALAREIGDIERRHCIDKASGFDVRNDYAELRAAIERYGREREQAGYERGRSAAVDEKLAAIMQRTQDRAEDLDLPSSTERERDTPALQQFHEAGGDKIDSALERLRFFCSLAMNGQDWLDVEPLFEALEQDAEPVARIDPMQDPMRPGYFMNYAENETPAEMVLRKLACWLGVGGYNAPKVDAEVFHRKIVDGVQMLLRDASPPKRKRLTDERGEFLAWWKSEPHRLKYDSTHPAFLAAYEAWCGSAKAHGICDE